MKRGVLLIVFIFLLANFVSADTYYVRTDGNNSLDGLSLETAWDSIAYALENSNENSQILV